MVTGEALTRSALTLRLRPPSNALNNHAANTSIATAATPKPIQRPGDTRFLTARSIPSPDMLTPLVPLLAEGSAMLLTLFTIRLLFRQKRGSCYVS